MFSIHKKTIGFVFLDFDVHVSDDCVIVISDMLPSIEFYRELAEADDLRPGSLQAVMRANME